MKSILPDIVRRIQHSPAESLILQEFASHANVQGMNAKISYEALSAACDLGERWTRELV
jgi:hypothetical protein